MEDNKRGYDALFPYSLSPVCVTLGSNLNGKFYIPYETIDKHIINVNISNSSPISYHCLSPIVFFKLIFIVQKYKSRSMTRIKKEKQTNLSTQNSVFTFKFCRQNQITLLFKKYTVLIFQVNSTLY